MEYRYLGKTGVQVSSLCYGTMSFGGDADEATSGALWQRCREAGINFFDCANVYNGGRAEEILGRLMASCRDEVVITSKAFFPSSEDRNARGSSRRHLMLAVEESLRRLGTDRLDFYFLHAFDMHTPIEEMLAALDDLVHAGKILYPSVSNWAAWQIATALGISARKELARFACLQPMYNLVKRQAEVEILPLAQAEELGVISYSPLGGGLLSGKYTARTSTEAEMVENMAKESKLESKVDGRLTSNAMYAQRYGETSYYETAQRFNDHAREKGYHPATLAVAWVMAHPAVTAPIIGARNVEQLEPSLQAVEVPMTPEWRAEISAFSPTPPPATDRSEEQHGHRYGGALQKSAALQKSDVPQK